MSYPVWPAILKPSRAQWQLLGNYQRTESPLTGTTQTLALPGARWLASLTFDRRRDAQARTMRAFIARMAASGGRCWLPPHDALTPGGSAQGTPLVRTYGLDGYVLETKGWTPNQAAVLLAGDYIQYGSELNMLAEDAAVDADGFASLQLVRPVRVSPLVGDAVIVNSPAALMELSDPGQAQWSVSPPIVYAAAFSFFEVLGG